MVSLESARSEEYKYMGNRLPTQVYQRLLRLFCDMRTVIIMEEVNIFTSRSIFSGCLRKFLGLVGVSGSGDCDVLSQQLSVQNISCFPQAAGENRGEACVSDGRASEQLVAHLRAGSR